MKHKKSSHKETIAIHTNSAKKATNHPVAPTITQTSTFAVPNIEAITDTENNYIYTRYHNPTFTECETVIANLEKTEAALIFPSGMSAITSTILSLVKSGDHIIAQTDHYWNAQKFLQNWLPNYGVTTRFVETNNITAIANAIQPNTKLIYLESPSNPLLKLVDLTAVAQIARQHQIVTVIDNTLCSPINQNPTEFGIDLIVHSATKYLAGHSDLLCGAVAGNKDLIQKIHFTRSILGSIMDPHAAWLLLRGIRTLSVRMKQHNQNALQLAEFLQKHPAVRQVYYPFLTNHPQYELAKQQMHGGSGVVSFEIEGSFEQAKQVVNNLQLFSIAASLGGIESLVIMPSVSSHSTAFSKQLIRLSVGLENINDLIADVTQALAIIK